MKKMAILTLTPEAIRELLHLPDGSTLIALTIPFETPGVMKIKIEGAGWDNPEGQPIRHANAARAAKDDNGNIVIDWRLGE